MRLILPGVPCPTSAAYGGSGILGLSRVRAEAVEGPHSNFFDPRDQCEIDGHLEQITSQQLQTLIVFDVVMRITTCHFSPG